MTTPNVTDRGYLVGPSCRRCARSEADCAKDYPCCTDCTHSFGEEPAPLISSCSQCGRTFADAGRGRPPTRCETCRAAPRELSRCTNQYAGTDTGYSYHRRDQTVPCDACRAAHAAATRARNHRDDPNRPTKGTLVSMPTQNPAQPTISETISRARQISDKRVTGALTRVEDAVDRLRDVLNDHESKAAARREVERLERQLADARAKLRGGASRSQAASRAASTPRAPVPCRKCGRECANPQGRAKHEASCTGTAA